MNSLHRLQSIWLLTLVLLCGLGIRIAAAAAWSRTAAAEGELFRLGDSHSYWSLGKQLGEGKPYQYGSENARIFRAPLYPLLLAPITQIADERQAVWVARLLGCVLGTLSVGLLSWLALRIAGPAAAGWAAVIGCVYPSAIGMSLIVLSEAVFIPLMIAHLLLWQSAWQSDSVRRTAIFALLAGCVSGLAVLARPSWLLFTPFLLAAGLGLGPRRKTHLFIFVLSLAGTAAVMAPWWVRNALITGKFVPTTLQVGPSLYDGWHAGATGASDEGMEFMKSILAEQLAADAQSTTPLESTLEWRLNRRATDLAVDWAAAHPLDVAKLSLRKLLRTWSLWPGGGQVSSFAMRLVLTVSCFGVLVLAIVWSLLAKPKWDWLLLLCWLPCIYFSLLHMVFVGSIRYREPGVFVLAALAGCAVAYALKPKKRFESGA